MERLIKLVHLTGVGDVFLGKMHFGVGDLCFSSLETPGVCRGIQKVLLHVLSTVVCLRLGRMHIMLWYKRYNCIGVIRAKSHRAATTVDGQNPALP